MAGISRTGQTDGGRGDTNEGHVQCFETELSDDSFEYDDESIIRMRLSTPCHKGSFPGLETISPVQFLADGTMWLTTRPTFPTVQERTNVILRDVTKRIDAISEGIQSLREQTKKLSFEFQEENKRLDSLKPLKKCYKHTIKNQIQQLEELNYLNGLISYLQMVDKEIVLLPCRYDTRGDIFPLKYDSDNVRADDSVGQLSLAELGESYREFSSDESATGL